MLSGNKRLRLSFIWVIVNFIGIMAATLVAFFLYALLTLHYDNVTLETIQLLIWLTICGAIQGFIVSVLQMMILVLKKCQLVKWLLANTISMATGMVIPTVYMMAVHPNFEVSSSFNDYAMSGWLSSWILAGALGGIVLGKTLIQRLRWGLLNAGAYLYWGACAMWGMRLLGMGLYNTPKLYPGWLGSLGGIVVLLVIGAWLQSYVFFGIMNEYHDIRPPQANPSRLD